MDRLTTYRETIKTILSDYVALANRATPRCDADTLPIFDGEKDHYMVYRVGWNGKYRVSDVEVFVRILAGKVWLEVDWTDEVIAQQLTDSGIPKEDLRFGFHHPLLREESASAVA